MLPKSELNDRAHIPTTLRSKKRQNYQQQTKNETGPNSGHRASPSEDARNIEMRLPPDTRGNLLRINATTCDTHAILRCKVCLDTMQTRFACMARSEFTIHETDLLV